MTLVPLASWQRRTEPIQMESCEMGNGPSVTRSPGKKAYLALKYGATLLSNGLKLSVGSNL